jgi:uncharacterized surface anchored protein
MVVKDDILGGLKSALERGESLKRAMNTLFNSGYEKAEIEEAARALSSQPPIQPIVSTPEKISKISEAPSFSSKPIKEKKEKKPFTLFNNLFRKKSPETIQKVSSYGENGDRKLIIILVISLILLVASLLLIFIFKQQLIDLFSSP